MAFLLHTSTVEHCPPRCFRVYVLKANLGHDNQHLQCVDISLPRHLQMKHRDRKPARIHEYRDFLYGCIRRPLPPTCESHKQSLLIPGSFASAKCKFSSFTVGWQHHHQSIEGGRGSTSVSESLKSDRGPWKEKACVSELMHVKMLGMLFFRRAIGSPWV